MKAILVIDMPKNCAECKLMYLQGIGEAICNAVDWEERPSWCPLRPMPMKRISTVDWLYTKMQTQSATSVGKYPSDYTQIKTYEPSEYDKGWNDCLDMLEDLYD